MRVSLAQMFLMFSLAVPTAMADDAKAKAAVSQSATSMVFPFYQCRYTLARGEGTVDEKTFAIHWKSTKTTVDCRYAVDGDYEAFEQFGNAHPDLTKVPSATKQGGVSFVKVEGFSNEKMVRGAAGHGDWMDVFGNLTLTARPRVTFEKSVTTPLGFFFGHRQSNGLDGMFGKPQQFAVSDLGEKVICGRPCVGYRFEVVAERRTTIIWFDTERGMLPVWQEATAVTDGRTWVDRTVMTAARELSKDRWFPERELRYDPRTPGEVLELTLTDVNVDTRPTRDQLSVALPAGTVIRSDEQIPYTPTKAFNLRQDEKVSGHDIPELFEKLAAVEPGKPMDTALRHDSGRQPIWFWVCGGVGLFLVVYGGYRWLRHRRSAPPSP